MKKSKILVIGDLMLDEYWLGESNRISPEAPAPIVDIKSKEFRVGGAGNVAVNLSSLGADVTLVSSTGRDLENKIINKKLNEKSIQSHLKSSAKIKTIKKLRILIKNHQMIRLDFEDEPSRYKIELNSKLKNLINKSDLIILSDYNKGALIDVQKIIKFIKSQSKKVIIDPKGIDFSKYKGANILTPNLSEITSIIGKTKNRNELISKSKTLIKKLNLDGILVTQGKDGMTLITSNKVIHKESLTREVYDVTGAGDTVIATFSYYLSKNIDYEEILNASNAAASIVIQKIGTSSVTKLEIDMATESSDSDENKKYLTNSKEISWIIKKLKSKNKKIVMTNGCFDILHVGHIHLLESAKKMGDHLLVAINSDKSVKKLKGSKRPVNKINARIKMLSSLSCVDSIIVFNEKTPEKIIKEISPNFLVKGGDYKISEIVGSKYVKSYGGVTKIIKTITGYSTTKILNS